MLPHRPTNHLFIKLNVSQNVKRLSFRIISFIWIPSFKLEMYALLRSWEKFIWRFLLWNVHIRQCSNTFKMFLKMCTFFICTKSIHDVPNVICRIHCPIPKFFLSSKDNNDYNLVLAASFSARLNLSAFSLDSGMYGAGGCTLVPRWKDQIRNYFDRCSFALSNLTLFTRFLVVVFKSIIVSFRGNGTSNRDLKNVSIEYALLSSYYLALSNDSMAIGPSLSVCISSHIFFEFK